MRIDFVEADTKNKKRKKVSKLILITILIIIYIIVYLVIGKDNNDLINGLSDVLKKDNELLPKYTDNAKVRMQNLYSTNEKIVYLTFDDGPSANVTSLILDVLKEQNIKATFFVLGCNVEKHPEVVKRAYEEGHYIANHGYSHKYEEIYKSPESVLEEYEKTEELIQKAIGNQNYSSYLFRFPGGYSAAGKYRNIKEKAGELLNENNIFYISWNALTGDAESAKNREDIINNIKDNYINGKNYVVLMHDTDAKMITYETLEDVIEIFKNDGYTFENFYSILTD